MADSPRKLSDQVKAKISFSQRRLWAERLKCKRAKENFMMAWAGNVAQTAKKGGIGEDELHWDSYMLIKREMDFQIVKHAEEKVKALEMKRVRTEKAAQARAAKKALRAIQKPRSKERENKAKKKRNNQEKAKEVHNELDVESWLTKCPRKTTINGQISSQTVMLSQHFSLERLDLQVVEMEKLRKKVSLADEIRAAKSKRTESDANVGMTAVHPE